MELISKEEFTELANHTAEVSISIYIPSHRSGVEVNEKQDAILFKNALQAVHPQLSAKGMQNSEIDELLAPCYELYKNEIFWNNQLDGLSVFISNNYFKAIQLPFEVNEEVYINNTFFVSPLLPMITNNEEFYLLALSKQEAKLYLGNAFGLQYIAVDGMPDGMEDVIQFDEKVGAQLHRRGSRGGNDGGANFHGQENQLDDKTLVSTYFQEVDRTVFKEVLHDKHVPLILAGVEYLIPIYKSISKYNAIADEAIYGNQQHTSQLNLYTEVRNIVAPYFKEGVNKALQNYYNGIATSLTSSMPEKVIPASFYAQIADLFICKGEHIWGRFDEANGTVDLHAERQEGDECLLNKAAVNTYINGGDVYLLDREKMPKDSVIAAFLRF
jgi:hypothetical protein